MKAQSRSKRKLSGGRYHSARGKRKSELAGFPAMTQLSERVLSKRRGRAGHIKLHLRADNLANVADVSGKIKKVAIKTVVENKANPQLVRRNIMTKGAIIETELGKARITSRPGQDGMINAVLVK